MSVFVKKPKNALPVSVTNKINSGSNASVSHNFTQSLSFNTQDSYTDSQYTWVASVDLAIFEGTEATDFKTSVVAIDNGVNGVGGTIELDAPLFTVDGESTQDFSRILINCWTLGDPNAKYNGIYEFVGGTVSNILVRSVDYDNHDSLPQIDYQNLVPVRQGFSYGGRIFAQTNFSYRNGIFIGETTVAPGLSNIIFEIFKNAKMWYGNGEPDTDLPITYPGVIFANGDLYTDGSSFPFTIWIRTEDTWTQLNNETVIHGFGISPLNAEALSYLEGQNTGDQNTFSTLTVSGENDIIADSVNTSLEIIAGSNISITTNNALKQLTINSTGGGGDISANSITFTSTSGIIGTTTNDNAAVGSVGEYVTSQVLSSSGVSLTNITAADVTSISLTAGDWDVWGNVDFMFSVSGTQMLGWVSSSSATLPDRAMRAQFSLSTGTFGNGGVVVPYKRFSLASTTTIYLSVYAAFASGTAAGAGGIHARRVR